MQLVHKKCTVQLRNDKVLGDRQADILFIHGTSSIYKIGFQDKKTKIFETVARGDCLKDVIDCSV